MPSSPSLWGINSSLQLLCKLEAAEAEWGGRGHQANIFFSQSRHDICQEGALRGPVSGPLASPPLSICRARHSSSVPSTDEAWESRPRKGPAPRPAPADALPLLVNAGERIERETLRICEKLCGLGGKSQKTFLMQKTLWASERRIRLPPAQGAFYSQAGILASPSDGAQSLVKGESQGVVGGAGDDSKRNRTKFQVPRPFVSG